MKKLLSSISESFGFRNPPEEVIAAESHLSKDDLSQIRHAFRTSDRHGSVLSYSSFSQWCHFTHLGEMFSLRLCLLIDKDKTSRIHYNDYLTILGLCHQSRLSTLIWQLADPPNGIKDFFQKAIEWNGPTQQKDWNREVESLLNEIKSSDTPFDLETFKAWLEQFPIFVRSFESILHGFKTKTSSIDAFPRPQLQGFMPRCLLTEVWAWLLASNLRLSWRESWELLFASSRDGKSFITFMSKIRNRGVTLIVIEDEEGRLFGGLASTPWEEKGQFYGDFTSFLFTLWPRFGIYKPTGSNENFQWCGEKFKELPNGVGFGGQIGFFSLFVNQDFETGMSHGTMTYGSPTLSSSSKFQIKQLECWLIERSEDDLLNHIPKGSVLDRFKEDQQVMSLVGKKLHSDGYRD